MKLLFFALLPFVFSMQASQKERKEFEALVREYKQRNQERVAWEEKKDALLTKKTLVELEKTKEYEDEEANAEIVTILAREIVEKTNKDDWALEMYQEIRDE